MRLEKELHQIIYFIITNGAKSGRYYNAGAGKGAPVNSPTF